MDRRERGTDAAFKLRRRAVHAEYADVIDALYAG